MAVLTIIVLVITGVITSFGLFHPFFLMEFSRNPIALSSGEWWHLSTPLFLHDGGWSQIILIYICSIRWDFGRMDLWKILI